MCYKKREKGKAYKISCLYLSTMNIEYFQSRRYINIVNGLSQRQLPFRADIFLTIVSLD